jgi:hypothetical protein
MMRIAVDRRGLFGWLLFAVGLCASFCAYPCSQSIDGQLAADRRDRARQREIVGELSGRADTIFVGTMTRVDWTSPARSADFSVSKVLKGAVQPDTTLTFTLPMLEEWTCTVSGMFTSVPSLPIKDERYVVYVNSGDLIRVSRTKRKWPEISAWEEGRLIRAQLAKD